MGERRDHSEPFQPGFSLQEVGVLRGLGSEIYQACFSPSGSLLLTLDASSQGPVRLWDVAQQKLLRVLSIAEGEIYQVAFTPGGELLVTACDDGVVRFWGLKGERVGELPGHNGRIIDLAFFPDEPLLFTGDQAGWIRLWHLERHEVLFSFHALADAERLEVRSEGEVEVSSYGVPTLSALALSPDGSTLVAAYPSARGQVQRWHVDHTALHAVWMGSLIKPDCIVKRMAYAPNGRVLSFIVHDFDMDDVRLYDGDTFQFIERIRIPAAWAFSLTTTHLAFSPDSHYLAIASGNGSLGIWDATAQRPITSRQAHTDLEGGPFYSIGALAWAPIGGLIATGGYDPIDDVDTRGIGGEDYTIKLWVLQGDTVGKT